MIPEELRYTEQHEWVFERDGLVRIGLTDIAQEAINQMIASYSFTANAGVLKAQDGVARFTFDDLCRRPRARPA